MYVVIELQTNASGLVSNIVTAFDTLEDAYSKYYTILSVAAKTTLPVHAATIIDNKGNSVAAQAYGTEVA